MWSRTQPGDGERVFVNLADYLRRQFAYDEWANREVLAAVRASKAGKERSLQLIAHIVSAERVWLERLQGAPQTLPVWSNLDLEECERQAEGMGRLWREYLDLVTAGDVSLSITYKNSQGESWTSTVDEVLTHVVMHSSYHRGQIASHMRASGETPAYTDFIHGLRQGLFK